MSERHVGPIIPEERNEALALDDFEYLEGLYTWPNAIALRHRQVGGPIEGICYGIPKDLDNDADFELLGICVASTSRGTGIGRALIQEFEVAVSELGYDRITVPTALSRSLGFYKKLGYSCLKYRVLLTPGSAPLLPPRLLPPVLCFDKEQTVTVPIGLSADIPKKYIDQAELYKRLTPRSY